MVIAIYPIRLDRLVGYVSRRLKSEPILTFEILELLSAVGFSKIQDGLFS